MSAEQYLEKVAGALQENVLTLLCFDTASAKLIRLLVTPELFESRVYQVIAARAIDFLDQYGEAIQEHLPDELEDKLKGDPKDAKLFLRTVENLYAAKEHMNAAYITAQLQKFVHEQRLKVGLLEAVEHVEAGRTSDAEVSIEKALRDRVDSFDPGIFFADPKQSMGFLDRVDDGIPLGIPELDRNGVVPSPGTMLLLVAPAKKGKSWWLVHVGKMALMQRLRVLHITLENSAALTSQRYIQSFFSISKRESKVLVPSLRTSAAGAFMGVDFAEVVRPCLSDPNIRSHIKEKMAAQFRASNPLVIKQFPTGALTMQQYRAYLDTLERIHHFIPDLVIIDYPDLMSCGVDNKRAELGDIFKNLRGEAVARNHALAVVTQGNRQSAESRMTMDTHVAEDYSKIATADTVLTYSQTIEEKRLGLARLFVSNCRGDADKFTVLVTQAYGLGQFVLDSMPFRDSFWDVIDRRPEDADD